MSTPGPHPRREPRFDGPLTPEGVEEVFQTCADFTKRTLFPGQAPLVACYLVGMVKSERLNEYVFRPLVERQEDLRLGQPGQLERVEGCALSAPAVVRRTCLDQVALDIVSGSCAIFVLNLTEAELS